MIEIYEENADFHGSITLPRPQDNSGLSTAFEALGRQEKVFLYFGD
ncbi:hypothetical protein [Spongiibacter sp. IMCC21906]|nr:hypothetical protein [Spongiibacter sp. IMCC21906]